MVVRRGRVRQGQALDLLKLAINGRVVEAGWAGLARREGTERCNHGGRLLYF